MRGHLGAVDALVASGGPSLLLAKDILNCTPVHLAAVQNQVTLIIRLVGALLEDTAGRTPLHEVARRRCMQDFMGFLHLGWESATLEDDGAGPPLRELSPLWAAAANVVDLARPGLPTVQRVLGWHPLHVAAMSGSIDLIQRLVQQFDCDLRVKSMNSWTPLHYAAAYNQVAAIEALCALGCEVAVADAVGSTPMHVAAGEGHLEAVRALAALGCSPQVVDRDGCTPLYCAAAWNRIEAVRLLERLHCPSSLRSLEGRTPTHVAAEQGWVELIDVLVGELGNAVDARDNYQFTPLHSAANGGHVAAVRRLAELGHELDARDYLGRTPLHYAAMHGRAGAVEELVRLGAGLGERDARGGYTALHLAADAGQCEAVARLVGLGAPVDAPSTKGLAPLALALMKGPANVDAIALLVELGADVGAVLEARNLETPLHVAARSGRADVIARLVRCPSISVGSRTKDGSTPLHYAAAFGQTHVLEALVEAGCPVDARDNALNTPMHLAAGECCGRWHACARAAVPRATRACCGALPIMRRGFGLAFPAPHQPDRRHSATHTPRPPHDRPSLPPSLPASLPRCLQAAGSSTRWSSWWSWAPTSTRGTSLTAPPSRTPPTAPTPPWPPCPPAARCRPRPRASRATHGSTRRTNRSSRPRSRRRRRR
jgi:cytohesin